MAMRYVKFFNGERGYGFHQAGTMAGAMSSCTSTAVEHAD